MTDQATVAADAQKPPSSLPNDLPVEPLDGDAKDFIDRLKKFGGQTVALDDHELAAVQASALTGVPMKASNMLERLSTLAPDQIGKLLALPYFQALFSSLVEAAPAALAQAAAPVVAAPAPAPVPAQAPKPAPVAQKPQPTIPVEERIRAAVGSHNRNRTRPPNYVLPSEEVAQRLLLDIGYDGASPYGEDYLIPAESTVTLVGRAPAGCTFDIAEVRRVQLHPFALDRLLVASVMVDDVQIAGQGPATPYGRGDGAPTAVMSKTSTVSVRLRNLTRGPVPIALSILAIPLVRV